MADSYYDIAQELRKKPGIRLLSKGTTWDRVYVEQETLSTSREHPRYPKTAADKWPAKYQPGAQHPKCKWLILVDAYITGGDDHKQNWTFIYQLDIRAFHAAYPSIGTSWEALLAKDGVLTTYPAQDDSPEVTWTFTVVNPDNYTRAAQGTVHPLIPNCLLIAEQSQRDGLSLTVTRVYHKVAPLTAQAKIGYTITGEYEGFNLVTWSYETRKEDYTPPTTATTCTITGFESLKVIKPPDIENLNTENLRVTLTYGALPGPLIALPATGDGPAGDVVQRSQRRAITDGNPSGPFLASQTSDDNGFSKVWNWVTLNSNPVFLDFDVDSDTRDQVLITRQIVSTLDSCPNAIGSIYTQSQINPHYALRTRRYISGTPSGYTLRGWFNWYVPKILTGLSGNSGDDGQTWTVNYVGRGGYEKKHKGRVEVDFFSSAPSSQSIFEVVPSSQVYRGVHFSLDLRGWLTNAISNFGSSGGSYVETVNIAETSPTASGYLAAAGNERLIAEETRRFWTGHYMRTSIYITIEI